MITKRKVKEMLKEAARHHDTHLTIDGYAVPFGCEDCIDDLEYRINDMVQARDRCSPGSAARGHYSGVLHQLRKDKRAAQRVFDVENPPVSEDVIIERLTDVFLSN